MMKKMVQENSISKQNQNEIFQLLDQRQMFKFVLFLTSADKHYEEYKKDLERIAGFFENLQLKYEYLSETNNIYQDKYEEIRKYVENLKSLIYDVPSPAEILNKAYLKK